MTDGYSLVLIDLPENLGQVYVRAWASGEVDVDFRESLSAVWTPIGLAGGAFTLELDTAAGR